MSISTQEPPTSVFDVIKNQITEINDIIPNILKNAAHVDPTEYKPRQIAYSLIELLMLLVFIIIIAATSPENILLPETAEGAGFIGIMILLGAVMVNLGLNLISTDVWNYFFDENAWNLWGKKIGVFGETFGLIVFLALVIDSANTEGSDPVINAMLVSILSVILIVQCVRGVRSVFNPNMSLDGTFQRVLVFLFSTIVWILLGVSHVFNNIFNTLKDIVNIFIGLFTEDNKSVLIKYLALFCTIIYMFGVLYAASEDEKALTGNYYMYALLITIPLLCAIWYAFPFAKAMQSPIFLFAITGIIITFLLAAFYFYTSTSLSTITTATYMLSVVFLLIIIQGLAIFFYIFSNYLKTLGGWKGFLVYLFFYIPCLVIDFVKYVKHEFAITTNDVFILFVSEVLLIILYVYLPKLIKRLAYRDGIVLIKDSVFLNTKQVIGNSQQFIVPPQPGAIDKEIIFRKNYSLSMWVFLNNESLNNASYAKETTIFDYGGGKPKITYYNNTTTDSTKDKYIIYFTNNRKSKMSYEMTLPGQKWNNFVFNYSSSKVDLYINGVLERTFTFSENAPTYNPTDMINVGSKNGLYGAICNVRYYADPLSSSKIANMYNLLMYKNPPTINL